jgi:hypothetical protein
MDARGAHHGGWDVHSLAGDADFGSSFWYAQHELPDLRGPLRWESGFSSLAPRGAGELS